MLGLQSDELTEDSDMWRTAVQNYWSLLSPIVFSDHPKRPGEEDPSPPYNMFRNVLDMNAHFGGFNTALLQARKSVWVMNVVPISGLNYLPLIQDRGFVGVLHDWYFHLFPLVLISNALLLCFHLFVLLCLSMDSLAYAIFFLTFSSNLVLSKYIELLVFLFFWGKI